MSSPGEHPPLCPFAPVDREAWEELVRRDLHGRPAELLRRPSPDGFEVDVLYTDRPDTPRVDSLPGQASRLRGGSPVGADGGAWTTCQEYTLADPADAARAAALDLARGATAAWFLLDSRLRCGSATTDAPDGLLVADAGAVAAMAASLAAASELVVDAGAYIGALAEAAGPRVSVVADPLGALAVGGRLAGGLGSAASEAAALVRRTPEGRRCLLASGVPFDDAGASDSLALAAALASAVELLRRLEAVGVAPARAAARLRFRVSVGRDLFTGIAKLRGLRILWSRIAGACGLEDRSTRIHARTGWREWTGVDMWSNLLRGTVATFGAVVGGADSIATEVFDRVRSDGVSELGARLATNTQVLLREESQLARVIDPGGGSYYLEHLTESLARAAWQRFQAIERGGGFVRMLETGVLQAMVDDDAGARALAIAEGRWPIVGVSEFATFESDHLPPPRPTAVASPISPASAPETAPSPRVEALARGRDATPFERLRSAVERHATATGQRPAVFVVDLGSTTAARARGDFAARAFGSVGLTVCRGAHAAVETALDAFAVAGARVAAICPGDEGGEEVAAELAEGLRRRGAAHVWLVAPPSDVRSLPGLAPLHQGCDLPRVLQATLVAAQVAFDGAPGEET